MINTPRKMATAQNILLRKSVVCPANQYASIPWNTMLIRAIALTPAAIPNMSAA